MQWKDVIHGMAALALGDTMVGDIARVEFDSRAVGPGALFVAMRGESADGNRFVRTALEAGAAAIITDSRESFQYADARHLPVALVQHGRRALAHVSANLFAHPERQLRLTGITGTNGKTTTAFLTEQLLQLAHRKTVLIGTIETHVAGAVRPSLHTTPESRDVLAVMRDGVAAGATEVVMEMSSHALDQERVWGLPVDVAVYTNLTQDHLDYHGTMENYAASKARLFSGVGAPSPRVAIINADDAYAPTMLKAASNCNTVWRYSLNDPSAEFFASDLQLRASNSRFRVRTPFAEGEVHSQLTGRVNVYNLLAAMAAPIARGLSFDNVVRSAAELKPVPGRFETVPNNLGIAVIVDYAHTDDALRNLTSLAREMARGHRVITVFGCGGDRDRTKRPKMGRAAGEGSDVVIVTSDNPRSEDPAVIAREALEGVHASGNRRVSVVLDRAAAIKQAIDEASAGDVVLIAGKGHEKTQTANGGAQPFDDVAVAAAVLRIKEEIA